MASSHSAAPFHDSCSPNVPFRLTDEAPRGDRMMQRTLPCTPTPPGYLQHCPPRSQGYRAAADLSAFKSCAGGPTAPAAAQPLPGLLPSQSLPVYETVPETVPACAPWRLLPSLCCPPDMMSILHRRHLLPCHCRSMLHYSLTVGAANTCPQPVDCWPCTRTMMGKPQIADASRLCRHPEGRCLLVRGAFHNARTPRSPALGS